MKTNQHRGLWIAGLLILTAALLAACGADTSALLLDTATPPGEVEGPTVVETEGVSEPEQPAVAEATPEEQPAQPAPTDTPEASDPQDGTIPEPELGFERGDPKLKATDPATFVRATGKPQLVELFAFW